MLSKSSMPDEARMTLPQLPHLVYASPRKLPKANQLAGRVVILDVAFASEGIGKGFAKTTGAFITQLGDRLACWVDHHDHPAHAEFAGDDRFVLATKAEHGACPEMVTPDIVARTGPVDTIVAHFDLDGLYAAAKWIRGGIEAYKGADADAYAVDTRIGTPSPVAVEIDMALRARWVDPVLKNQIVRYLVAGLSGDLERAMIREAAAEFTAMAAQARELAQAYEVEGDVALVRVPKGHTTAFDKTELLLLGQAKATVSAVVDRGNVTIAADFSSGVDFLKILGIGGGMPTRVSVPEKRLERSLDAIRKALAAQGRSSK